MRKFFVKTENIQENKNEIEILGSDVNHIKNVLRLKLEDEIQICNQDTSENYIAQISNMSKEKIQVQIIQKIEPIAESNVELHIFQGLPKAAKMELMIQKGTELGVSQFIPVAFKRSIVKLAGKEEQKKLERWQKIAEVAAKQSKRDRVPEIKNIISVKNICNLIKEYDILLVAYENESENTLKNELLHLKNTKENFKIAVVIGPEGGMEEEEVFFLQQAGAKVVSLGKRILRTETVALQVSSIILYELET